MAAATSGGDAGGCSSGGGVGGYGDLFGLGSDAVRGIDGGYSCSSYYSSDNDEFLEPALSMEQQVRLTKIWVANPTTSHHCTHGIGSLL